MSEVALPHDLEAERSLLGGVLIDNNLFDAIAPGLKAEHFYRDAHQHVYRAIETLRGADQPLDFRLLMAELKRVGQVEDCGGPAYVSSLVDGVPRAVNVPFYARIVLDHALRRALIAEARRMESLAAVGEATGRELLEETEHRLLEIDRRADGVKDAHSAREMAAETYALLVKIWNEGGRRGLSTGLDDLDEMTRGLRPGQLVVVGARPSMGKSALAMQIATHVAETKAVLFFSLEMSREELSLRVVSMLSNVSTTVIESGNAPEHAQRRIGAAIGAFGELNLYIDETAAAGAAQVRSKARRKAQQLKGLGLIVVDYLQLMATDDKQDENRNLQLGAISGALKRLARELNVPLVLLSQLNRNVEHRTDKRPGLADLRESGAIEQDADVVMLLHRPHYYDKSQDPQLAEIILAKQRNGPTGTVAATWLEHITTFRNRTTREAHA